MGFGFIDVGAATYIKFFCHSGKLKLTLWKSNSKNENFNKKCNHR